MNSIDICRKIIETLNAFAEEYGLNRYVVGPDYFTKELGIPEKQLNVNIDFLEQEGYIDTLKKLGSHFHSARLTSNGRKLMMSPSEFNREFPTQSIVINGNNNVAGSNLSLNNSYNSATEFINNSTLDKNIKEELRLLISEINPNDKNNEKNIQNFFKKVIANSSEKLIPEISTIALKSILIHLGINI